MEENFFQLSEFLRHTGETHKYLRMYHQQKYYQLGLKRTKKDEIKEGCQTPKILQAWKRLVKVFKGKHFLSFIKKKHYLEGKATRAEDKTTKPKEQSFAPRVCGNLLQQQLEPSTISITEVILFIHFFSVRFFQKVSSINDKNLLCHVHHYITRTMSNTLYILKYLSNK